MSHTPVAVPLHPVRHLASRIAPAPDRAVPFASRLPARRDIRAEAEVKKQHAAEETPVRISGDSSRERAAHVGACCLPVDPQWCGWLQRHLYCGQLLPCG